MPRIFAFVLALLFSVCTPAFGAIISYTDSASFLAALAGRNVTVEGFETQPLNSVITNGSTLNGLTYSGFPRNGGRIDNEYNRIGNQSLAVSGSPDFFTPGESFTVNFGGLMDAVGIFFNVFPSPVNSLQIVTSAGTAGNGAAYDTSTLYFVGLISDTPFASATFVGANNIASGFNVDNLTFVPEPATLALFGLGLAGLASTRRRKQ